MLATRYEEAVRPLIKTPEMVELEMDEPSKALFNQFQYTMPNGVVLGIGKSRRPHHASLFQIVAIDLNGKNAYKLPEEYRGEYTSPSRAEHHLRIACKEAWAAAEAAKSTQTKRTEAKKDAAESSD